MVVSGFKVSRFQVSGFRFQVSRFTEPVVALKMYFKIDKKNCKPET